MTRVWNITDGGQAGVKPHNRMVLGKMLKPGQYISVEESRLAGAIKIRQDVSAKLLHVGKQPPSWYSQKKKPPRAVADGRRVGSDGRAVGKRVEVIPGHSVPVDPRAVELGAMAQVMPDEPQAPSEEELKDQKKESEEESDETGFGRRRKRK